MDYKKRIAKLQKKLPEIGCDAFIVDDAINLYYLTGLQLSAGKLLLDKERAVLFVDGRYYEACKKTSPVPVALSQPQKEIWASFLSEKPSLSSLGFNSESTSFKSYLDLKAFLEKNQSALSLIPAHNPVRQMRMLKDADEITLMMAAAELGSKGYDYVCSLLKEGVTEIEIANELEIFWKRQGSKGVAFDPIIAFGTNTSMPHYRPGNHKLKKGDPILIDIGVNLEHYHSDMTRVVFFGSPAPQLAEIYTVVRQAQEAALALCKPGITIGALDQAARDLISTKGYAEFFPHGLGHGVGLEIHELPVVRNYTPFKEVLLQEGMVLTVEPGVYLPDSGGVRLEDTVVITKLGYENLTKRSLEPKII